jgi:hypothetical protein
LPFFSVGDADESASPTTTTTGLCYITCSHSRQTVDLTARETTLEDAAYRWWQTVKQTRIQP